NEPRHRKNSMLCDPVVRSPALTTSVESWARMMKRRVSSPRDALGAGDRAPANARGPTATGCLRPAAEARRIGRLAERRCPEYAPAAMELITIRFSHYNEKARWALDRFGVVYTERAHLPLIHMPFAVARTRFMRGWDGISSSATTP